MELENEKSMAIAKILMPECEQYAKASLDLHLYDTVSKLAS